MAAVKTVPLLPAEPQTEGTNPDADLAWRFLHYMFLMREVEERIERRLYRQGKIPGGVYSGRGQEAISVGAGLTAEPDDVLFPCHRDMALYFIRGVHPRQVFAQYMGRVGGLTRGKDGNMHMGDIQRRLVAIISSIGAAVPVAAGAALALKYRRSPNIVYVFFGDGATSRGDWHEGVNFASVQKLPLVLICNNNQYAYSTPLEKQMACPSVAHRGPAYCIPAETVDGNDPFAVYAAVGRAASHARQGLGPYLVECATFRMSGHAAHDPADYVPKHLFQEWAARDPILRLEQLMLERAWADRRDLDQLYASLRRQIDEAIEWAENSPFPHPSELTAGVYEGI